MDKIAVQNFGLIKELTEDLSGTIRKLAEIGFDGVEPFLLFSGKQGARPKRLWSYELMEEGFGLFKALGLQVPSAHVGLGNGFFSFPVGLAVQRMLQIHRKYGVDTFVASGSVRSVLEAKKWGKLMGRIAAVLKNEGCRILYHNHDMELKMVAYKGKAVRLLDIILEYAGPDVMLELDIGWAGVAGDEVELVKQYADRIAIIHLKDFAPGIIEKGHTSRNMPASGFSAIGEGTIRTAEVLATVNSMPNFNGWVIIDQDASAGSMLADVERGFINVRKMG